MQYLVATIRITSKYIAYCKLCILNENASILYKQNIIKRTVFCFYEEQQKTVEICYEVLQAVL